MPTAIFLFMAVILSVGCASVSDARGLGFITGMARQATESRDVEHLLRNGLRDEDGNVPTGGNVRNDSFQVSKKLLEKRVYFDHRITLYCGASFDARKNIQVPEGFTTPDHDERTGRVEWEHAVPAENFGRAFPAWREGDEACVENGRYFRGRKCAELVSMEFRRMQADMYNLFPAIGSVNAVRSNYMYSELPGIEPAFGSCEAKVRGRRFEPPDRAKGEVARAALYMAQTYPSYRLSEQQRRLFTAWDQMYPVTEWECVRAKRISRLQGNDNTFVKDVCVEAGLW